MYNDHVISPHKASSLPPSISSHIRGATINMPSSLMDNSRHRAPHAYDEGENSTANRPLLPQISIDTSDIELPLMDLSQFPMPSGAPNSSEQQQQQTSRYTESPIDPQHNFNIQSPTSTSPVSSIHSHDNNNGAPLTQHSTTTSTSSIPPPLPQTSSTIPPPPGKPPSTRPHPSLNRYDRLQQLSNKIWLIEYFSWALSLFTFLWITLVLSMRQDKPLPSWPLSITINALISVLSAVMKSSLLLPVGEAIGQLKWNWFRSGERPLVDFEAYDGATRGPWGSVLLLWTSRARYMLSTTSSAPSNLMFITGVEDKYTMRQVSDPVRAAVFSGLYFSGNPSDDIALNVLRPHVACPTGNCSFPLFDSLAVCNQCANVTDLLEVVETYVENSAGNSEKMWNTTLPGGFNTGPMRMGSTTEYISSGLVPSLARLDPQFPLLNFVQLSFGRLNQTGPKGAVAMECALHWCMNRYKSEVVNGILKEEVVASSSTGSRDPSVNGWFHTLDGPLGANSSFIAEDDFDKETNRSLKTDAVNRNYHRDNSGDTVADNQSIVGAYPFGRNENVGYVHLTASEMLAEWAGALLSGYRTWNGGSEKPETFEATDVARRLYQTGNATLSLDMLALSLSAAVREAVFTTSGAIPNDGRVTVEGWGWSSTVLVRVQWGWIALPALLEAASLAFLLFVAWDTKVAGASIWKNSSLAVLFHGMLDDDGAEERDLVVMEKMAEEDYGGKVALRDAGYGPVRLE
ncbi:hypothetical protein BU24DRAFT_484153 [Aaosphaeria arxii CBS 175.79]|uniref:DUF3176 domain containing protein n=1 Tax=Aaosphaeria arxii CBS 175.79 TaxID=1450172 RepID=A0A6A5XI99_9PLEO|nr:uncharacterized protein BU24DRAFT_484153 [Aaosphaeria arxii CBS 175.79]KAF2012500.1 hypothetical protein BU24DRAFT_484153 [Aaosphaeria arxii CBS 175.79]